MDKRAWLDNWQHAHAVKCLMQPPELTSPDGIYWLILHSTGDEDLARDERLKAIQMLKIQRVMNGR